MKISSLFALTFIFSIPFINAQTISEWREENRTGVSSETGLLTSWPENGPDLVWMNLELPKGNSSVSFSSNTLFLTGTNEANDILVAIDSVGVIKWQTPYGRAWNESFPESRCTPTVEGDRVYVSSGLGDLACVDAITGAIIWSLKASETYKGTFGPWGIAESLLIDGEKLYFTPGGSETTTIALEKTTGKLLWKTESLNDIPGYVSPIMIENDGKKLLVNVSGKYVFAVDVSTGAIAWKINHVDIYTPTQLASKGDDAKIKCVTPLYHEGKIYVTSGYNQGGVMLQLTDAGNNAAIVWTDSILDVHHGGALLFNGYIYGSNWLNNSTGNWICLDWNTGKKMYDEKWNCKGSIIAAEGMLYIYDEKIGNVGLVKANPEKFEVISSFKISKGSGPHWGHPVIHKGKLYIRHGEALMVYDIKKRL